LKTLFLIAFLSALAFSLPTEDEARELFKEFQLKFDRTYISDKEHDFRFRIFQETLNRVEKLNAESTGATYGITKFSDMTPEEFEQKMLTRPRGRSYLNLQQADYNSCAARTRFGDEHCAFASNTTSFDWRTKGAVTGVKDQGQCGSCWSFGTTGDLEGTWFLAGHTLTSLSEQQLVSCDKSDSACNGGLQENAFSYIIRTGGIQSEAAYPYASGGGVVPACKVDSTKFVAHMSAWAQVSSSPSGESAIAPYLVANGPVTIGINANPMQDYTGGIDNPSSCSALNLNHAVLIVGYGTEGGVDYWLIKNSWGTSWGESGYYRIVRGVDKCGLARDVVHSLV